MNTLVRNCLAELFGVFALTFIGGGAIVVDYVTNGAVGLVGIALAHGLALAVAVSATMNVSGGHINPAITLGLTLIGRCTPGTAAAYIVAQLAGAALAGAAIFYALPVGVLPDGGAAPDAISYVKMGTPAFDATLINPLQAVVLEFIGTFLLAFAVYGTAAGGKAPQGLGGFGVGLTLTFVILCIGPITGSALNPARHFGTALFAGQLPQAWIYWTGPVLGAAFAFFVFRMVLEDPAAKAAAKE